MIRNYNKIAKDMLKDLISFNTVLDKYDPNNINAPFGIENKKCLDYLVNKAKLDGFDVVNVDNYAISITYKGQTDKTLGILAHADVVPVNLSDWNSNPFELKETNDLLIGRGTIDDKSSIAICYTCLLKLKDNNVKLNKNVKLIIGFDEESGSRCIKRFFEKEKKPDISFSPDASFPAIYGEKGILTYKLESIKSDNDILMFESGQRSNIVIDSCKVKFNKNLVKEFVSFLKENNYYGEVINNTYIVYGKSAHAMEPFKGINASFIMIKFINKYFDIPFFKGLEKYYVDDFYFEKLNLNKQNTEFGSSTNNLGLLNLTDDKYVAVFNSRLIIDNEEEIINTNNLLLNKYNINATLLSYSKLHYVSKDSFLVKTLTDTYNEIANSNLKPFTIGGGTYARSLNNCIAFGPHIPGTSDVCHTANEYITKKNFYSLLDIYYKAIYKLGYTNET